MIKYVRNNKISMKDSSELTERWLQEKIAELNTCQVSGGHVSTTSNEQSGSWVVVEGGASQPVLS